MFKTIHNSLNISPTEIILVSKLTLTTEKYRKNNFWLWSEIFQRALEFKIRACVQNLSAANGELAGEAQHKMLNTIHNSVNISSTEIILVSK